MSWQKVPWQTSAFPSKIKPMKRKNGEKGKLEKCELKN